MKVTIIVHKAVKFPGKAAVQYISLSASGEIELLNSKTAALEPKQAINNTYKTVIKYDHTAKLLN